MHQKSPPPVGMWADKDRSLPTRSLSGLPLGGQATITMPISSDRVELPIEDAVL